MEPLNKAKKTLNRIKLIYNPQAGTKRKILPNPHAPQTTLEDIKELLNQYEFQVDPTPTKYPGHATELAEQAIKEHYKLVVVAGGDGTVGEVVNGLVGSEVTLGILPLGSFMNVSKMLSIPLEIEKAVQLLKIGRVRKIDLGKVIMMSGQKMEKSNFFLESAGFGLEAQLHEYFSELEKGENKAIIRIFKTFFEYFGHRAKITIDQKKVIETRASLVTVSNGPFAGAAIPLAPKAKLNDHRLTLSIFRMSKWELIKYFLRIIIQGKRSSKKVEIHQAKDIKIETRVPRLVHADARFFGTTPVEFEIVPNALNVITGFPKKDDPHSLIKRTYLEP